MIPLQMIGLAAALSFAAGAAISYKFTADHFIAAGAKKQEAGSKTVNEASAKLEGKKNDARVVYRTVTRNVQTTVERPIYRDDCLDDGGLRDADAALARGAYSRKPDAALPGPDADDGQDGRRRAAEDR